MTAALERAAARAETRDRPIIFSTPMVRALLAGTKTQTRRIIKPVRGYEHNNVCRPDLAAEAHDVWWHGEFETVGCMQTCPYGLPGDRLWVREAFREVEGRTCYRATPKTNYLGWDGWIWRPSIHMPRWASRLTLRITDVRAQRLQNISEDDARAEGAQAWTGALQSYRTGFYGIWNHLHGSDAWDANPWVWALTFAVEHRNVDAPRTELATLTPAAEGART